MARRRKEDAELTRQAVLDAAERVFFEHGVAGATLEGIARAVGVTCGAGYWHLSGKLDLFLDLESRVRQPYEALLGRLGEAPGPDALTRASGHVLGDSERDPRQRRLLAVLLLRCEYVAETARALERQHWAADALRAHLMHVFAAAADQGRLHPCWSPASAAQAFFALFVGSILGWLHVPEGTDRRRRPGGDRRFPRLVAGRSAGWKEAVGRHSGHRRTRRRRRAPRAAGGRQGAAVIALAGGDDEGHPGAHAA